MLATAQGLLPGVMRLWYLVVRWLLDSGLRSWALGRLRGGFFWCWIPTDEPHLLALCLSTAVLYVFLCR